MSRRAGALTPAVRRELVEAIAHYAYDEWRLGRYHGGVYAPMWHELSEDERARHRTRATGLIRGTLLPTTSAKVQP